MLGPGKIFFYRYIIPDDDRSSIKNDNLVTSLTTTPLIIDRYTGDPTGKQNSCHFEIGQNHVHDGIINVISKSKMAVYLPERITDISIYLQEPLRWVLSLHILQFQIFTCGFIFNENYHALSIIPRVINSATILAQQSSWWYSNLSSEH